MNQNNNQNNPIQTAPPINNSQTTPPPNQPQRPVAVPIQQAYRRTKSRFNTFFWSLIPGAGQMYHGLLKKGISVMLLFWGIIGASVVLYIPVILFALPIIWFYSFFDSINRINMSIDELNMLKDSYMFEMNFDDIHSNTFMSIVKKRNVWIGWGLTLLGIYSMFRLFSYNLYNLLYTYFDDYVIQAVRDVINLVPSLIVPIICIIIGVKLLKNSTIKAQTPKSIERFE